VGSPQTLSEADRRLVAAWAADCAERVLGIFEAEAPDDDRPRALIARTRAFARGELNIAEEIRRRLVGGVGAGEVTAPAAAAAARAAGQAVAVCHMGAHALGAAALPSKPPVLRTRTGQKPSKTRSAGSSTTCRQRFAPPCEPSRLSVKTRRALLGPGSSLQANSAPSSVTCKPVSPRPTRTNTRPKNRAGPVIRRLCAQPRPVCFAARPERQRQRSSVRKGDPPLCILPSPSRSVILLRHRRSAPCRRYLAPSWAT